MYELNLKEYQRLEAKDRSTTDKPWGIEIVRGGE